MKRRQTTIQLAVFIIVVVVLALAFSPWLPKLQRFLPRQERPIVSGPSASWSEIISAANGKAKEIDKDALLNTSYIAAYPVDWPTTSAISSYTTTLEVSFDYSTPSGNLISIRLQDAAPTSTITSRVADNMTFYDSDRQNQLRTETMINSVRLSPRDAIKRTWEEVHGYGQKLGLRDIRITPVLFLETYEGNPLRWRIEYAVKDAAQPTPDVGAKTIYLNLVAHFLVDAQTGEILKRTFEDRRQTPVVLP
jgi:hypothetical protein